MWMAQTTASGMVPWYHWLGGAPEDLRWRETGRKFFQWIAANVDTGLDERLVVLLEVGEARVGLEILQLLVRVVHPPGQADPLGGAELVGARYRRPLDWLAYPEGTNHEIIVGEDFVSAIHRPEILTKPDLGMQVVTCLHNGFHRIVTGCADGYAS